MSFKPTAAAISPEYTVWISARVLACICRIRPIRSRLPFEAFNTYDPEFKIPEYTRKNVKRPTNGSVITLNANEANGASSSAGRSVSSSVLGLIPLIAGTSSGEGK